jgi:NTE family protein
MKRRQFLAAAAAGALLPRAAAARSGVALVLGGGGCRGYGHLGVIRALEKHGLKPGIVVGSSVGSLVGAFYAAGISAADIERYGMRLKPNTFRDWIFPNLGVFGGGRIRRFVEDRLGARSIESLPVRFAAVATDLRSGELVLLTRGSLGLAVQASASAPGLLEPVKLDGKLLVDGNLASPVPVNAARGLGAKSVIAVDVSFPPAEAELEDPYDALYQGFSILTRRLAQEEGRKADLLLAPSLPKHNDMSPQTLRALVAAGEQAVEDALPRLKALLRS